MFVLIFGYVVLRKMNLKKVDANIQGIGLQLNGMSSACMLASSHAPTFVAGVPLHSIEFGHQPPTALCQHFD